MKRLALAALAATLAACTVPPPAPPPPARGPAARPQRARPAAPPAVTEPTAGEGEARTGGRYRVRSDGTVGCADPQAPKRLRQLKADAGASPRLLAQAHREGGCMTTFRSSLWALEAAEGEVVRLRLAGQGATALHFLREEVAPAGE